MDSARHVLPYVTTVLDVESFGRIGHELHQAGRPFSGNGAAVPPGLLLDQCEDKIDWNSVVPSIGGYVIFGLAPRHLPCSSPGLAGEKQSQKQLGRFHGSSTPMLYC